MQKSERPNRLIQLRKWLWEREAAATDKSCNRRTGALLRSCSCHFVCASVDAKVGLVTGTDAIRPGAKQNHG